MAEILAKKQFIATKLDVDETDRTVTAVISTGAVDRDSEVLVPKGVKLEAYQKNPVVLFAHNYYETPIAKALWVKQSRGKITAKAVFAETEKAEEVYQLFKGGFLNAFSVGFKPLKGHSPQPDEVKKTPEWANARWIIDEWELLEFSVVPVPANSEALVTAIKSKSITLSGETQEELEVLEQEITTHMVNTVDVKKSEIKTEPVEIKAESIPVDASPIAVPVKKIIQVKALINVNAIYNDELKRKQGIVY